MTDETEIQDSQPDEQVDATTEELDTPEESNDASELIEKNKHLFERAKKSEAEAKLLKEQLAKAKQTPAPTGTVTLDEVVLLKEYDIDDLTMLKTIQAGTKALGKDMSLLEAKESELFKSYHKERQAKVRQEKAQLSASGKSLNVKKSDKPLTRDEHMKMFNEIVNK